MFEPPIPDEPHGRSRPKMRSSVITSPRRFTLAHVPRPEPKAGQARIRLLGCGVCGSNMPVWQGRDWFKYPLEPGAPGHEGWGIIDLLGDGVEDLRHGQRVAFLSGHALAEYDLADRESIVPIPEAIGDEPFPGEPLGCAFNIFRRSDIQAGQTVAIIGIGFLGAILTRLATDAGARVLALTRRPWALDVARQFGAAECIPIDDHQRIIGRVRELTDGRLCERVIEVVGEQWPLDLAGELTSERGRLVIAGYHQDGPRQVNMQLWNWRGLDVVNAHERDRRVYVEGMRLAIEAIAAGRLNPRPLYTHQLSLGSIDSAFDLMEKRPDGFLKALVLA